MRVIYHRRNYYLLFVDPTLFTIAMTFLSANIVITYFLTNLGATTFEISLANTLVPVGACVSQPLFANWVINVSYKLKMFVILLGIQRVFLLFSMLSIPLLSKSHPHTMIVVFLCAWGVFNFFTGTYGPFYMSLFAKMIAEQQRGRLRGFSIAVGNLIALGASYVTEVTLKDVAYPYNYWMIFSLGAIFLLLDVMAFAFMKEEPDIVTRVDINYFKYFHMIPRMFRENKRFPFIVMGFSFLMCAQIGLSYYALFAVRTYHARITDIALFTAVAGVVNILGNISFGMLSDRYSHRLVVVISGLCGAFAAAMVIGVHQLWAVYFAFALTSLCQSGYNLSSGILIIEHVARHQLPMCVSINTLITLVVSSVGTLGSGLLISHVSFASVFILTGMAALISCGILQRFAKAALPGQGEVQL